MATNSKPPGSVKALYVFVVFFKTGEHAWGYTQAQALGAKRKRVPEDIMGELRNRHPNAVWRMFYLKTRRPNWQQLP